MLFQPCKGLLSSGTEDLSVASVEIPRGEIVVPFGAFEPEDGETFIVVGEEFLDLAEFLPSGHNPNEDNRSALSRGECAAGPAGEFEYVAHAEMMYIGI